MRRSLPLLASLGLALAACAGPAPVATERAEPDAAVRADQAAIDANAAAARFDAAVEGGIL